MLYYLSGALLLLPLLAYICHSDHFSPAAIHRYYNLAYRRWNTVHIPEYTEVLDALQGRWLSPGCCRIVWGWQEPQTVGNTFHFVVEVRLDRFLCLG